MTVTLQLTEEEVREYLRYKQFKGREVEEIEDLAKRLTQLAENVYKALADTEEEGLQIINEGYAHAALHFAEKELF